MTPIQEAEKNLAIRQKDLQDAYAARTEANRLVAVHEARVRLALHALDSARAEIPLTQRPLPIREAVTP